MKQFQQDILKVFSSGLLLTRLTLFRSVLMFVGVVIRLRGHIRRAGVQKMAFDANEWSNEDLYRALSNLGIATGPVTETTRAVYIKRLKNKLQESPSTLTRSSRGCHPAKENSAFLLGKNSSCNHSEVKVSSAPSSENGSVHCSNVPNLRPTEVPCSHHHNIPQSIREDAPFTAVSAPPPPTCSSSSSAQKIVDRLLQTFDDGSHAANDTVFFFSSGEPMFASRSVLASQCQHLIPVLYSSEDMFGVRISSLSGLILDCLVRSKELVIDLKEKIYLRQGLRVEQQRLVYRQKELCDFDTLHNCGVELGATLHLVMAGTLENSDKATYSSASCSPALSIHHLLEPKLHPEFLFQQPHPFAPHHTHLSSHILHIVHVNEGVYGSFRLFLQYLYCHKLPVDRSTPDACTAENFAVCWILGEFFQVPSLVQACRAAMDPLMSPDKAQVITIYADAVKSNPLKDFAQNYMTH